MSGSRTLTPARSHARPRPARNGRFGWLPSRRAATAAAELGDFGDGLDAADAVKAAPEPDWDTAVAPRLRGLAAAEPAHSRVQHGETQVDLFPPAPRRYVAPGGRWPEENLRAGRRRALTRLAAAPAQPPPLPADLAEQMARVVYPPAGAPPERMAAVMCQVSAATGVPSPYEEPHAWGAVPRPRRLFSPLDVAMIHAGIPGVARLAIRPGPCRLAIEAAPAQPGKEAAA